MHKMCTKFPDGSIPAREHSHIFRIGCSGYVFVTTVRANNFCGSFSFKMTFELYSSL